MKRGMWLIAGGCVGLVVSCMNPLGGVKQAGPEAGGGTGGVTVSAGGVLSEGSRTVVPDFTAEVDSIEIVLTSNDGYAAKSATVSLPASSYTFAAVETGSWDIGVRAKKAGIVVGSGDLSDQQITAGATVSVTVPIAFAQAGGTGKLSLAIRLPQATGIDYVEGAIDGGTPMVPTLAVSGSDLTGSFAADGLAAGIHDLAMSFRRGGQGGTPAGVFHEGVNIWENLTSDRWIDASGKLVAERVFAASEFYEATASLSALTLSVGTLAFAPETLTYDAGSVTASVLSFTPSGSAAGQYLQYRLNGGGWVEIAPGASSSPIALQPAANTLEIRVTAPDRITTRTYSIAITKSASITPITIDHTNFDPSSLSDPEIAKAAALQVYFEHASVGGNIFSDWGNGFDTLMTNISRYTSDRVHWDTETYPNKIPVDPSWYDTHHGLADVNRGNPGAQAKVTNFTNSLSGTLLATKLDVASFKFCWIDTPSDAAALFTSVRLAIEALQGQNSGMVFFWWTMPIERDVAQATRQAYNDLVREYCAANGQWLLDIAALESHDDAGNPIVDSQGRELQYTGYSSDGGHLTSLGSVKMAKAYWKLLAEIAKTR